MPDDSLSIISGAMVRRILDGQEDLVLQAVTEAYLAHGAEQAQTPGTRPLFVNGGRFFAMPASLEDDRPIVGVKWVASFVGNVSNGGERASAMLIVNDARTGRPVAVIDGTLISAKRTAAGAAVALRQLAPIASTASLGLVGCGPIHYEVLRFIAHLFPIRRVYLADLNPKRVDRFAERVGEAFPSIEPIAATLETVLHDADVVSIATNTTTPHIMTLPQRPFVLLHISLRDLAPAVIVQSYNIVDDVEHVCTARTSIHLAVEETGHRDFIRGTIPGLLAGTFHYERPEVPTIVSPFGLGTLDLAVVRVILARAAGEDVMRIPDFRGTVWN
jgi:N-[(2S)-2-amino-2-carboxyethyl]-L-glutamate dehydrogenase